jgi:hypothetical protein
VQLFKKLDYNGKKNLITGKSDVKEPNGINTVSL